MMLRKILLFASIMFVCTAVSAQTEKNLAASKMLKTATTLMEAQQFDAAEEYFKKGLSKAKANYDAYQQAVAYEGLGGLYAKTERPELAIVNYKSAVRIYRSMGYMV